MSKVIGKPPVDKLPLAARKSLRDTYDPKKSELEAQLTEKLSVSWTIDINPNAIYAYVDESTSASSDFGACLREYIVGAIGGISNFVDTHGDLGKGEINTLCSKHLLTLELDVDKKCRFNGADVKDGKLVMLFSEGYLGINIYDTMNNLKDALNAAEQPSDSPILSYAARASINQFWEGETSLQLQRKIARQIQNDDIKLNPDFKTVYTQLKASKESNEDSHGQIGLYTKAYFESLCSVLEDNKFVDDDLLYEGFAEAVDQGEICIRIVDKLTKGGYNEAIIEGGVLYLQTTPKYYGYNISDIARNIVDLL